MKSSLGEGRLYQNGIFQTMRAYNGS